MLIMNEVKFIINNCMKCPYHYVEKIYTSDSFEHEEGCYCKIKNNKLVVADDWDLEKWAEIPDWCPLIGKETKL